MRHGTTPLSLLGGVAIAVRLHIYNVAGEGKMKRNSQFGLRNQNYWTKTITCAGGAGFGLGIHEAGPKHCPLQN